MKIVALTLLIIIGLVTSSVIAAVGGGGINAGNPVPYLQFDRIMTQDYGSAEKDWMPFSRGLVTTFSELNGTEQGEIWYGPGCAPAGGDPHCL